MTDLFCLAVLMEAIGGCLLDSCDVTHVTHDCVNITFQCKYSTFYLCKITLRYFKKQNFGVLSADTPISERQTENVSLFKLHYCNNNFLMMYQFISLHSYHYIYQISSNLTHFHHFSNGDKWVF